MEWTTITCLLSLLNCCYQLLNFRIVYSFQLGSKINKSNELIVVVFWSVSLFEDLEWNESDERFWSGAWKPLYVCLFCLKCSKISKGEKRILNWFTPPVQTFYRFVDRRRIFYSFWLKRNFKYPLGKMTILVINVFLNDQRKLW